MSVPLETNWKLHSKIGNKHNIMHVKSKLIFKCNSQVRNFLIRCLSQTELRSPISFYMELVKNSYLPKLRVANESTV